MINGKAKTLPLILSFMKQHFKHEEKLCPRCGSGFECKPGDIANCQCSHIKLTEEITGFINRKYGDCLCRACLLQLSPKQHFFKEKFGSSPH